MNEIPHEHPVPNRRFRLFRRLQAVLILLPLLIPRLSAEPVSLENLLRRTGATLSWDPWRRAGRLTRGDTTLVFRPGNRWMILNGEDILPAGTVLEEEGRLIFSSEAASAVLSAFGSDAPLSTEYRLSTILIDPGHGGRDSGASRSWPVDGLEYPLNEKDVVLELSLRLAESLRRRYPDKNILLTRGTDTYPTLEERVQIANGIELGEREGMIYISVHANASLSAGAEGFEVWYLPRDYRRTIVTPGSVGSTIAPIVNTLWEEEFTHESVRLADMILRGFENGLGSGIPNRGRREESWFVVRNAKMASVLVEVGFLTNQSEAARLRRPDYLSRIGRALYNGVADFVEYFESKEILF